MQQDGFEPLFDYFSGFAHLNGNLGSAEACRRYHDDWIKKYRAAMDTWDAFDIAAWAVRLRQSLKMSFSAAYFALAAEESRASGSQASAYFLAYYSSVHAMWATLFLLPGESHDNVGEVTHAKLINVFHDTFASGKAPILTLNAKQLVEDLKFLREYYSYRMPLNSPLDSRENPEVADAHLQLTGFVTQALQLANLHSHLIHKAAKRAGKDGGGVPLDRIRDFDKLFFRINGKAHPSRKIEWLDPADLRARHEFLNVGCGLWPHSIGYEDMFDNFMTYMDDNGPSDAIVQKTRSLVYHAFY